MSGKDHRDAAFDAGMAVRRDMFGDAGAQARLDAANGLTKPFEELVTRWCFGDTWARPGLDRRVRSLITLAALTALSKPNQIKIHVRGALANGATPEEIREVLLHTCVYAGIPAGVEAFNAANEVLEQLGRLPEKT
jgi:4-carboxymuconolactone decarboxylase